MMRISPVSRSESVARFRLEGRLTQTTAGDLVAAIEPTLSAGATAMLDLAGVTFADQAGIDALRGLRPRGVVLAECTGFVSEMLRVEPPAARDAADEPAASLPADIRLLERLRRGDDAAFTELVERYGGRMLAVARRVLHNDDEARDAVQDAFLSAFRGLASFKGDAKLSTWLHRITVNAALMRVRSRKHRQEQSIDDLLPRFDEDGVWDEALRPSQVSSHELLERRESRALVRRCIDQLPDAYRTVLLLRDIEDLDTDEAAEVLGITPNATKIRLHRARQALRTLIERALQTNAAAQPTDEALGLGDTGA